MADSVVDKLATSYITAQQNNSIPGLLLFVSNPNNLTPVVTFLITLVVSASYLPFRSHQGQESGGAHRPAEGGRRARPSWNDRQLLKFLPSAQGFLIVIQACWQARDLW